MNDLAQAIAEVKSHDTWMETHFLGTLFRADIRDAIATILNAVVSGELIPAPAVQKQIEPLTQHIQYLERKLAEEIELRMATDNALAWAQSRCDAAEAELAATQDKLKRVLDAARAEAEALDAYSRTRADRFGKNGPKGKAHARWVSAHSDMISALEGAKPPADSHDYQADEDFDNWNRG